MNNEIKVGSKWGRDGVEHTVVLEGKSNRWVLEKPNGELLFETTATLTYNYTPYRPTCNGLTMEQFIEHAKKGEVEYKILESWWQKAECNFGGYSFTLIPSNWHWMCEHENRFRIAKSPAPAPTCNGLTMEQFIEHAKKGEIQLYAFEGWQQSGFNINGEKNIPPDWHWICNNESKFRIKPKQESPTLKAFEIQWGVFPLFLNIGTLIADYRIVGYGDSATGWPIRQVPCEYMGKKLHKYKYAIGVREG